MVVPLIITGIISLVTTVVILIAASLAILKNGKDITENIAQWFRDSRYCHIEIKKDTCMPCFVAICNLFSDYKDNVQCSHWQFITISDTNRKNKTFQVPSVGRLIDVELKNNLKVIIYVSGNYDKVPTLSGFKIYFERAEDISIFIDLVFSKYLSPEELHHLTNFNVPIPKDKPKNERDKKIKNN